MLVGLVVQVASAFVDRELGAIVGDDVVVERSAGRAQRGRDVISRRAGILTGDARVSRRHAVSRDEVTAPAGSQRHRIEITVGLAGRVGSPGRQSFVDGELGAVVGDDVVVRALAGARSASP